MPRRLRLRAGLSTPARPLADVGLTNRRRHGIPARADHALTQPAWGSAAGCGDRPRPQLFLPIAPLSLGVPSFNPFPVFERAKRQAIEGGCRELFLMLAD